jgi:REP element-mobilizing transposase RayT
VPRLPRNVLPHDGVYHVTTRGVARAAISRDDEDRRLFLVLLARAVRLERWECHVFCLMPNHYHLIVDTSLPRLSSGLHRINGIYAQAFNERHGRSGHLFGDRFASFVIRDDEHLRSASEYVLQNPVRAGLCKNAAAWPWSGARQAVTILRPRAAAG